MRQYQGEQEIDWPAMSYSPMPGLPPIDIEPMRCALGLEPTPEAYIGHLVLCFREVYRVMRDDATAWVVMGDSFASSQSSDTRTSEERSSSSTLGPKRDGLGGENAAHKSVSFMPHKREHGLHQGDLMLIPHRLALALQASGWIVRNDVVWAKVAPMPESVSGWRWERCRVKVHQATHPALVRHGDRSESGNPPHGADIRDHPDRTRWEDCPGCDKCSTIKGGDKSCKHEWRPLDSSSNSFSLQAEGSAVIENMGELNTIAGVQAEMGQSATRRQTPSNQGERQSVVKPSTGSAKANSSILPNGTVPIQEPPDEIRQDISGNTREWHDLTFTGRNPESSEPIREFPAGEINAPIGSPDLGPVVSEADSGTEPNLNKLDEGKVRGGQIESPIITNATISEDQSEDIGHVRGPVGEKIDIDMGLLSDEVAGLVTAWGTENAGTSAPLPLGAVDGLPTGPTGDSDPVPSTSEGTISVPHNLGGDNIECLAASRTNQSSHSDMICQKCKAVKLWTPHGGYVLRRGSWRHTRAHETILQCTKQMGYYADQERVREANTSGTVDRLQSGPVNAIGDGHKAAIARGDKGGKYAALNGRNPRSVLTADPLEELWGYFLEWMEMRWDGNPMDVLTPSPESYPGSHYAVYPRTLIAPLLRATAPTRVCPVCGAPWCPVVEQTGTIQDRWSSTNALAGDVGGIHTERTTRRQLCTLAHRPTCSCIRDRKPDVELSSAGWLDVADEVTAELAPIPGWALDPFAGTFTTGEVCAELGVNAVGIDLSMNYLDSHAKPRINLTPSGALDDLPLFEGMAL